LAATAAFAVGQTFDVNGQQSSSSAASSKKQPGKTRPATHPEQESGMGWGSSIEVAREARAAQTALQHNDPASATQYAQRAVKAAPQNVELWFTLAYAARLSGQYSVSVDAYQKGLALKPNSVQGLSGLAQTYARMGKTAEAEQALDQVLAADPRSDVDLQLAGELLLTTDPKKAVDYLRRSEAAKNSSRTELLLARAYARTGDEASARAMLEHARHSAPNNPEVVRAVASYYRDTGHYDEAVQALESLRAKDANTLAELGYSYTLAGNAASAAKVYGEAANRAPKDVEIQLNAAQAMINAGDFGKATSLLSHAESLRPEHYRLYALRGRLASAEHQTADAVHQYEAALQHLPEGTPEGPLYPISLRIDLAELYRDEGDDANQLRVLEDAREAIGHIDPSVSERPEFLRLRAAVELGSGDSRSAESDLQEALHLAPHNVVLLLNYASLLRKIDRKDEAQKTYQQALAIDASSAAALGALGFLARESGDADAAGRYFAEFAKKHPDDYSPYLSMGDLYSETRNFPRAQENYEQAFKRAPDNPLIVSGAMNAALEAHHPADAKQWLDRASATERQNPQVMREQERYLTISGDYQQSAEIGYQVIEKLPKDKEGVDYLAYDLLFLRRFDEAAKIVDRYEPVLGKDYDLPLIGGYVATEGHDYRGAVASFTRALEVNPDIAVGYMNRGYVYNDMRLASKAEADFRKALSLNPQYGEARLGLAYALVQLRRSGPSLKEAEIASSLLPDSAPLHLVKAEAYRQRAMFALAEGEYKKALTLDPNESVTYLALADVQYRAHEYEGSAETLRSGLAVAPNDPMILADMGRSYARLGRSDEAMQSVASAERIGGKNYKVLLVSADAMRILKHNDQAMSIYARALEGAEDDRLQVRLALARLFADEGKATDAQQQLALGFAEARVAGDDFTSADDYLNAADILLSIREFGLAQKLYGRAHALGADDTSVAVGMANAELALGDTRSAELQLSSLPEDPERKNNFEFMVAQGNVYRQLGKDDLALANFTRANQLDPENESTRDTKIELEEEQGRPIIDRLNLSSGARVNPVFEDDNVYQLYARLLSLSSNSAFLPPPRRTIETYADSTFHLRLNSLPVEGFVAERNARGSISVPSELLIQNRDTYDTIFNVSVAPRVELGNVKFTIMPGLQYTVRRDTLSPVVMNQNLFRQFVYLSSSPIFDWFSFSGSLIRETGPFTEMNLHSRDLSGAIDFRVGRPWAKTALITGYNARNLLNSTSITNDYLAWSEYYQTISYVGLERQFSSRIRATAALEFWRAWRIANLQYAIAQELHPRFGLEAKIRDHWALSASGAWSSGRAFHAYDSVDSNVVVTYTRDHGWGRNAETAAVGYPMRLSVGFGQQSFYDFPGHQHTQVVPVVQFSF
jgi:tetratricopeptide (TPR) repeat protein